jgi:hypothetical protein
MKKPIVSLETIDPKKRALSREVAKHIAEWEAKNGPVVTQPCGKGAATIPFSVTVQGVPKRNHTKPTNLDAKDD